MHDVIGLACLQRGGEGRLRVGTVIRVNKGEKCRIGGTKVFRIQLPAAQTGDPLRLVEPRLVEPRLAGPQAVLGTVHPLTPHRLEQGGVHRPGLNGVSAAISAVRIRSRGGAGSSATSACNR